MNIKTLILLAVCSCCLTSVLPAQALVTVANPRCEYRKNPVGIESSNPRLSWQLHSAQRGAAQRAYHILVASSPEILDKNRGDLWDSGRTTSAESTQVKYAGTPLKSRMQCFWKLRVYDQKGEPSAWSEISSWSMGLLSSAEWQAQWIGLDAITQEVFLDGCSWIGFPEGLRGTDAPPGMRYYRRIFDIPDDSEILSAELSLAADNGFACSINGEHTMRGHNFSTAKTMNVAGKLRPGRNIIAVQVNNLGEKPNPAGLTGKLVITFKNAPPLTIATDTQWKAAESENAQWHLADFNDSAWPSAKLLGPVGMQPWGKIHGKEDRRLPARMLRREFNLKEPITNMTERSMTPEWRCPAGLKPGTMTRNGSQLPKLILPEAYRQNNPMG